MFLWLHKWKGKIAIRMCYEMENALQYSLIRCCGINLTNFTIASFSIDLSCKAFDPLPREMPRMCSDIFRAAGDARLRTSVFHCSSVTSGGFALQSSMRPFSRHRVLMSIFVMIGATHFSHTPPPFPFMYQSERKAQRWLQSENCALTYVSSRIQ